MGSVFFWSLLRVSSAFGLRVNKPRAPEIRLVMCRIEASGCADGFAVSGFANMAWFVPLPIPRYNKKRPLSG